MKKCIIMMFCSMCFIGTLKASPEDEPPSETPIDGGVTVLVASVVGYGIKKVIDERKRKTK